MAIAAGDRVSPHRVSTEFTRGFQAQPVRFGICDAVAGGNRTVLWEHGLLQAGIVEAALDEIVAPLSYAPMGKVVELAINPNANFQPSGCYYAIVVAVYRRDLEAAGTFTGDLLLVKLLNADIFLEVEVGDVSVLNNR